MHKIIQRGFFSLMLMFSFIFYAPPVLSFLPKMPTWNHPWWTSLRINRSLRLCCNTITNVTSNWVLALTYDTDDDTVAVYKAALSIGKQLESLTTFSLTQQEKKAYLSYLQNFTEKKIQGFVDEKEHRLQCAKQNCIRGAIAALFIPLSIYIMTTICSNSGAAGTLSASTRTKIALLTTAVFLTSSSASLTLLSISFAHLFYYTPQHCTNCIDRLGIINNFITHYKTQMMAEEE